MENTGAHRKVRTVTSGQPEWPVPVTTLIDRRPEYLKVTVVDGEVVVVPPPTAFVLSTTQRQLLDEGLDSAFQMGQQRDQWS